MQIRAIVAVLAGALFSLAVPAQDSTAEIEFQQRARALGQSIGNDTAMSPRCRELQQRVKAAQGRPQQHYTALDAFNAECRHSFVDSDDGGVLGNRPDQAGGSFLTD